MPLTEQQAHAAQLLAAGNDQRTVGAKTGKHPSTISRWRQDSEFATAVERYRQELAKATTTTDEVDTPKIAPTPRQLGKYALHKAIEAAKADGKASDWAKVAQLAAKLLDDDQASSPEAMATALNGDHDVTAKLVAALDPAALSVLAEATFEKQTAALGLSTSAQFEAFQHCGYRLTEEAAADWAEKWARMVDLMRRDALRTDALARHTAVAAQHGDEPDLASIGHAHPADVTALLQQAREEHQRLTEENNTNA